jgi:tight adherence protein C
MPTQLFGMPLPLLLAIAACAAAIGVAAIAILGERERRSVLRRATGGLELPTAVRGDERGFSTQLVDWLAARVPANVGSGTQSTSQLVQAGFESDIAPAVFGLLRIVSVVVFPLAGLAVAPRDDALYFAMTVGIAAVFGLLGPKAGLDRLTAQRQDKIRKGIPDALDLLVVCVEAGVALDAAVQRVARELKLVHPLLAGELVSMSRRISAGMAREQAMQGLYLRTGVDELRGLSSHMVQSEKWGTSIVTVLRVYSDQLRRKRKMAAERRAATASTRMLLPLAVFIFPTIFVVLLGPAMMRIMAMFAQI